MLAMGGTRTYHRLTCAVEDAGFEIRDCLAWMYGTGFPKGQGCLKPAWEPILLARKPGPRVLPLGIDACRVPTGGEGVLKWSEPRDMGYGRGSDRKGEATYTNVGRYPANVLHDGSDEVLEAFAAFGESKSPNAPKAYRRGSDNKCYTMESGSNRFREGAPVEVPAYGDTGSAARFFYCAKASKSERGEGNTHPTVKPLALMRWMIRLVTPEGGRVLDPFAGSGSTLVAATLEGREAVGVELNAEHCEIIKRRLAEHADAGLFAEVA
jgi:site-specific DNA-methyltransferase (adenine-specific)